MAGGEGENFPSSQLRFEAECHSGPRGTYCQGYLGFAKMYLELLELLLELLLQLLLELLLELLLLLLLFSLPRTW